MSKIVNMKCEIEAATWLNLKCDDRVGPFRTGALWELKLVAGDASLADTMLDDMERFINSHDELLEALIEAHNALNGAPNTVGLHAQIDAAIAKARGE